MTADEARIFYTSRYAFSDLFLLRPGVQIVLGDEENRQCRFCDGKPPAVTFKMDAHAILEALGNKTLFSAYECDACNQAFGRGIENDFGNWSKPMRTFARIRGKSGVPTLKKGGDGPGWRVEFGPSGFEISQYETDPIFEVDEANKTAVFKLKRDTYTPIAVLKAFVKIGLTVMPPEEMENFREALEWIRCADHTKTFVPEGPILHTFIPGPMPSDLLSLWLLRRRTGVDNVPYAFLLLGYGNELFQVCLPSPLQDACVIGKSFHLPHFPAPDGPDPSVYGAPRTKYVNMSGRTPVKGEIFKLAVGFEHAVKTSHGGGDAYST